MIDSWKFIGHFFPFINWSGQCQRFGCISVEWVTRLLNHRRIRLRCHLLMGCVVTRWSPLRPSQQPTYVIFSKNEVPGSSCRISLEYSWLPDANAGNQLRSSHNVAAASMSKGGSTVVPPMIEAACCYKPLLGRSATDIRAARHPFHPHDWTVNLRALMKQLNDRHKRLRVTQGIDQGLDAREPAGPVVNKEDDSSVMDGGPIRNSCDQHSNHLWPPLQPKIGEMLRNVTTKNFPLRGHLIDNNHTIRRDPTFESCICEDQRRSFFTTTINTLRPCRFEMHSGVKSHTRHTWRRFQRLPAEMADANTRQAKRIEWPMTKPAMKFSKPWTTCAFFFSIAPPDLMSFINSMTFSTLLGLLDNVNTPKMKIAGADANAQHIEFLREGFLFGRIFSIQPTQSFQLPTSAGPTGWQEQH